MRLQRTTVVGRLPSLKGAFSRAHPAGKTILLTTDYLMEWCGVDQGSKLAGVTSLSCGRAGPSLASLSVFVLCLFVCLFSAA